MTDDNGNVLASVDPKSLRRVHLVGVAGTGMGSFAGMLKAAGYEVSGSDENVYPPMSDMLATWGIQVLTPYRPDNLDAARPDLAVIGNVIRRVNPEATEIRARRLPQISFPAALGALFLEKRHSVVVAGTHGKTTTSSLMGHVLAAAGKDPSFLVGGVTQNYAGNYRLGQGPHFVVEGDEYDTAYFDKGPKFLHYRPRTLILTSVELDHADIYRDLAHYESSFEKLVALVPKDGMIAVSAAYPNAVRIARRASCPVVTYAAGNGAVADYAPRNLTFSPDGASFDVLERGERLGRAVFPLSGAHNVENALGVIAAARSLGLSFDEIARGLASFAGVKRRQEVRGEPGGVLVIDDFAHHPTAVKETIAAIRARYPARRLWAVFEPRSNTSRRNLHQDAYAHSFTGAARASLKTPEKHDKVPVGEELDVPRLVRELAAQQIEADAASEVDTLVQHVATEARSGDVVLAMSNGSFGGWPLWVALSFCSACKTEQPLPPSSGPVGMPGATALQLHLSRFPSGEPFELIKERGHVVLLDVWATWCEPCRDALPTYEALAKEYGPRGLKVYAINVDADAAQIAAFMSALKVAVPVLIDKDGVVAERDLHVKVMPTTFLVDKQGAVRHVHEGFAEEALMQYQTEIEGLLAEPAP
jgi:UDP-N-acetylmuramate: L-alanyl-gamma-D-glutamyl-meso-diaminopimelate ligase